MATQFQAGDAVKLHMPGQAEHGRFAVVQNTIPGAGVQVRVYLDGRPKYLHTFRANELRLLSPRRRRRRP